MKVELSKSIEFQFWSVGTIFEYDLFTGRLSGQIG